MQKVNSGQIIISVSFFELSLIVFLYFYEIIDQFDINLFVKKQGRCLFGDFTAFKRLIFLIIAIHYN